MLMTAMRAIEAMGTWAKQQKFQHLFREVVEAAYSAKYV
jgi:hypothetical protein